jgi:hypothetical protein
VRVFQRRSVEEALPVLRAVKDAQNEHLLPANPIDHEPSIKRQNDRDSAEFAKFWRGCLATSSRARKAAQYICGFIDRRQESVSDGGTGVGGETIPPPVDLTQGGN